MKYVKIAVRNLRRNKISSILYYVVFFILVLCQILVMNIAMTIHAKTSAVERQIHSEIRIEENHSINSKKTDKVPTPITEEEFRTYGKLKYVEQKIFSKTYNGAKTYVKSDTGSYSTYDQVTIFDAKGQDQEVVKKVEPYVYLPLIASTDPTVSKEFYDEEYKIIYGTKYLEKNQVLLHKNSALDLGVVVGEEITMFEYFYNEETSLFYEIPFKLKVVGIFEGDLGRNTRYSYLNSYTTIDTLSEMEKAFDKASSQHRIANELTPKIIMTSVLYEIKNPDYFEDFKEEIRQKGLDTKYQVVRGSLEKDTNNSVFILSELSIILMNTCIGVGLLSICILILASIIEFRKRSNECTSLRLLGAEKSTVIRIFILEKLLLMLVAIASAIVVATVCVSSLNEWLIYTRITHYYREIGMETTGPKFLLSEVFTPPYTYAASSVDFSALHNSKVVIKPLSIILICIIGLSFTLASTMKVLWSSVKTNGFVSKRNRR